MNNYGLEYSKKINNRLDYEKEQTDTSSEDYLRLKEVLIKFQEGYTCRDVQKVDAFVDELFVEGEEPYVLGTGTGELFLGSEQIKGLIKDDWEYWGDVNLDTENAYIIIADDIAWIKMTGTVKYSFEDTPQRYDNYVNFIKNKLKDEGMTATQKLTFLNWALTLTYHQRVDKKRDYLWPLGVSAVLSKAQGNWKFVHIHFSIAKANFPDERFENDKAHREYYQSQNSKAAEYKNNGMTTKLKQWFDEFEADINKNQVSSEKIVGKYFNICNLPFIHGTENQNFFGIEGMKDFFEEAVGSRLHLDLEYAIALNKNGSIVFAITGIVEQEIKEDTLTKRMIEQTDQLLESELSSEDKIFHVQRLIAYFLKESATGEQYTCPIRLTGLISNGVKKPQFEYLHFSYPSYWVFEGKLDSV